MAKMTHHQFAAGVIAAVLAFRQQEEDRAEVEKLKAIEGEGAGDVSDEQDESDLWEQFGFFVEKQGLAGVPNPDILCFAALLRGEPSFTLRGQDLLSSMLVRHWVALYENLAPAPLVRKVSQAEGIAEKMEMYDRQRWPD